jgi:uncharacterized protein YecE (DUF72 family)
VSGAEPFIGKAGWSLPSEQRQLFLGEGSHLERYAARFNCVEINSSFYRPHQPATYARWARSVPEGFRFAVKMPRTITHSARLVEVKTELDTFIAQASALGEKLGCLLVQLPPSLEFELDRVGRFLQALRRRFGGAVVLEPRHASWFEHDAEEMLSEARVGRVGADPAIVAEAENPAGDSRVAYFRLHGSPRIYYSEYSDRYLRSLANRIRAKQAAGAQCWCIFDNTASGAAIPNAMQVQTLIAHKMAA